MTRGAFSGDSSLAGFDPDGVGNRAELASALTRLRELSGLSVRDLARRIDGPVATVGGYLSGRHLPTANHSALFFRLLEACGVTAAADRQRWWEAVSRVRGQGAARPPTAGQPYRGLVSFQVEDAALFFGRELLTAELLAAVRADHGAAGRMISVVGPSGSGKSSLVRAGLIPGLRDMPEEAADGAGVDHARVFTPGDGPLRALAAVLAAAGAPTVS